MAHGNTAYIHLQADYRGPERMICGIGNRIRGITLLSTGENIGFVQNSDKLILNGLPFKKEGEPPRILKLELDGAPFGIHNPMWPADQFRVC